MLIFVVDSEGQPGHPTRRADWVRKRLRRGQARLVGGGASGKPPVLVLNGRVFDGERTVDRRFVVTLDTGFRYIGFCVGEITADGTLRVLLRGVLTARTPEIRELMDARRMYRRARRGHRRENILKKGRTAKHRPPRYEARRKRASVTLQHGVQTHLNLFAKLDRLVPLPAHQVTRGFEDVAFDLRALVHGKPANGWSYQVSPMAKHRGESTQGFVLRRDGGCIVCAATSNVHLHHLRKRSRRGFNRPRNQVALCERCHRDVHAGLIALPITGGPLWRDAGNTNAIAGRLRREAPQHRLQAIPVADVVYIRDALGLAKDHDWDAVAGAASLAGGARVDEAEAICFELTQSRRHRRARVHAQRDRLYTFDGKIVARNRHKRMDQTQDSLAELREHSPSLIGPLQVKRAVRLVAPNRRVSPTVAGDVWQINGQRFVAEGVKDEGRYLYSKQLVALIGKPYVSPKRVRLVLRNEGLVVTGLQLPFNLNRQEGGNETIRAPRRALSLPGMNAGVSRAI
ncbi:MAG TPA: RRXRR domain-containing protein [Gammaproteobacteria bacterium]|nr:RRXRR domain-containing protein [Gammaproteobacteria bacterium]